MEEKRYCIYPELEFERFESKAKKLLSFFSKNEGKYVVCGVTGLGLVLVYKVDYINDRLELDVSTDLITRRTVVVDAANAEKEVCFLGDEVSFLLSNGLSIWLSIWLSIRPSAPSTFD